jgi:Protein of unknown function (DUF3987)
VSTTESDMQRDAKALLDDMAIADGLTPWVEPVDVFAEFAAPAYRCTDAVEELTAYPKLYADATGIDLGIMLTAAIAAAAGALPDQIQVCGASDSNWFTQPRLWVLGIGPPGSGKTPGQREMIRPLWDLHGELDRTWRASVKDLTDEDQKPPRPRVIVGDTTIEALSEVLMENPRGTLVAVDEFDSWLGSLDQYKGGAVGRDRGEWLRLFDGGPHSIERIKRGTVFMPNWGASILTATTPASMRRLSKHLPEDGLLQRFLIVIARRQCVSTERPEFAEIEAARVRFAETLTRLWSLTPRAHNGVVPLTPEAKDRFDAWRTENSLLQEALGSLDTALEAHIAKYPTLALRLALVFHCARIVQLEDPRARDPASWPLPLATLESALRFLHRASQHALALYVSNRAEGIPAVEIARGVARFILARSSQDNAEGLQRRDVFRHVVAFRKAEEREQSSALRLLMDLGWIREGAGGYQKSYATRFDVSPYIGPKFAALAQRERERRAVVRQRLAEAVDERRINGSA